MNDDEIKWTSQQRFIATDWHVNHKWGVYERPFMCGICRKRFQIGDGVRWICATSQGLLNFFVCDADDQSDALETWHRISMLAQQDEYELAARIVQLESDLGASAMAEQTALEREGGNEYELLRPTQSTR